MEFIKKLDNSNTYVLSHIKKLNNELYLKLKNFKSKHFKCLHCKGYFEGKPLPANYQSFVNVWQLSKTRDKVYGYQLTNAYPIEVGAIETDDSNENALSMFSVNFAYSDFHPIKDEGVIKGIADAILGDEGNKLLQNIENLFD